MIYVITASRDWTESQYIFSKLDELCLPDATLIVHGDCEGGDKIAGDWGKKRNIHVASIPALWNHRKKKAGPERNICMIDSFEPTKSKLIAFPLPKSTGTWHCVRYAQSKDWNTVVCVQNT